MKIKTEEKGGKTKFFKAESGNKFSEVGFNYVIPLIPLFGRAKESEKDGVSIKVYEVKKKE